MNTQIIDWKKYVIVFVITLGLFGAALYSSDFFDRRRLTELKAIQDKISLDLMSSETEFSILEELSCKDVNTSLLTPRINDLESKIQYSEQNIGINNPEVVNLKRYYTILQIKDYLLMKRIGERCHTNSTFILYVYSQNNCADCAKESLVLNSLREKYPKLQIYAFDNDVDISAMKALISTYKVPQTFPAFVINRKVYSGYKSPEDIEKLIPSIVREKANDAKQKIIDEKKQSEPVKNTVDNTINEPSTNL